MAIIETYYIKILNTVPERNEMILMDNETGKPAEFRTRDEAQRWLVKNEDELIVGAYYDVKQAFKTDRQ